MNASLLESKLSLEKQLLRDSSDPAKWLELARLLRELGEYGEAYKAAERADSLDPSPGTGLLRAELLLQLARGTEALQLLERVRAEMPGSANVLAWMGMAQLQLGQRELAEENLRRALQSDPVHANALCNLALLLLDRSEVSEALVVLKTLNQAAPRLPSGWLLLARARLALGDASGAEQCLRNAESLDPNLPAHACFQMAGVLQERKAFSDAETYYRRAIELDPGSYLYRGNFADMLCSIGQLDAGFAQHQLILNKNPNRLRSQLALRLTLRGVSKSAAEVDRSRDTYAGGVRELAENVARFRERPATELESDVSWSNYLLAYQGKDDKALQTKFADFQATLLAGRAPRLAFRPARARDAKIRIGFASSFFYQCTVGWYFSSWITDLDRAQFEPYVYSLGPVRDKLSQRLGQGSMFRQVHHLPLFRLADCILADELDVLVFPELGLCPTTYTLAGLRLAPLQCAGWGHPVTSGHANVDWYFSSDLIEPADADAHYREKLIRLPGLGTRYTKPADAPQASRSAHGLPEKGPLVLVSQSLFKIHPDNDALYCQLIGAVPQAYLIFFQDSFAENTRLFRQRIESAGLVSGKHFTMLPSMSREQFISVNGMADIMLDTLHWSGGNTTLDALSCGLPVVTQPGRFMRGRQSLGMLTAMGCGDLVAGSPESLVAKAGALLESPEELKRWRAQILASNHVLYEQADASAALQAHLVRAVKQIRMG